MSLQTSQLNDMSSFMMLIANTTSCHPPTLPSLHLSQKIPCRPQQTRCYEFTYGVTAEIAHAIEKTLELGRKLSSYDKIAPQQEIPGEILEACESLGNQLLSWSLDDDLAKTVFPDDETMQVIFSHHAHAWHLSALVYYLQQIQGSSRSDIVEQVAKVSLHLHTVEDMKAAFPDNQMAPITWPAFVASCSSLDRETWVLWWARVQRYGIGTMKRQFEVVQEVWSALDIDPETNWLEIIRRRKIEVLAL
jgi:arginine metabolism regulation protein II